MSAHPEKILIADEDPDLMEDLARHTLRPMGYEVMTATDGPSAIQQIVTLHPDLVIASLTLPRLTAKDVLVTLRSQGLEAPVIVTAPVGMESMALRAFRLGARDYLSKPLREAEVVSAVERALVETRLRKEREALGQQLAETNQKLEEQVKRLTLLHGIGRAITSLDQLDQMTDRLLEGARFATEAEMGWLLLRDEGSSDLILRAQHGLPATVVARLGQAWDDGVAAALQLSGESVRLSRGGLRQLPVGQICQALLITPIKTKDETVGALAVANRQPREFNQSDQALLEAVAGYAAIAITNARLFRSLEARLGETSARAES
ncbi:MAG: response regulator [Anaerolineales bacterium]